MKGHCSGTEAGVSHSHAMMLLLYTAIKKESWRLCLFYAYVAVYCRDKGNGTDTCYSTAYVITSDSQSSTQAPAADQHYLMLAGSAALGRRGSKGAATPEPPVFMAQNLREVGKCMCCDMSNNNL